MREGERGKERERGREKERERKREREERHDINTFFVAREKWEGPVLGPDDAVDYLGVDEVNFCFKKL